MRTEEDLRSTFDHLADSAPAADEILAALTPDTRRARRRRTPLVLGTVLATAAAAIGGPLLVTHLKASEQQVGDAFTGAAWTPWISVPAKKPLHVNPIIQTPNRQVWELTKSTGPWSAYCLVTAHRNGDFDPKTIPADSATVDVNGAKGRVIVSPENKRLVPVPEDGFLPKSPDLPLQTVAWQPARGLWALVTCETQVEGGTPQAPRLDAPWKADLPKAMELARAISTGGRLASPFKIGYLPDGIKPQRITYSSPVGEVAGSGHNFVTLLSDGNPATGFKAKREAVHQGMPYNWAAKPGDDLKITYTTSKFWNRLSGLAPQFSGRGAPKPDLMINGMGAWYVSDGIAGTSGREAGGQGTSASFKSAKTAIRIEDGGMAITVQSLGGTVSQADLVKVAEGLQLARSTTDQTTWYDAATAIPAPK